MQSTRWVEAICDPGYRHAGVNGFEARPGWWHLTGPLALAFARVRHDTGGSDFQRMRRQQDLLVAIHAAAVDRGADADPIALMGGVGSLRTDLPPEILLAAAALVASIPSTDFRSRLIQPFGLGGEELYDARGYVLSARMDEIAEASRRLFTTPGRVPNTGRQEPPPDKPAQVKALPRFNGC